MRKFKVNNSAKQEPTKEQIARYKDFTTLSHRYDRLTKRPKKPLYRDQKLFMLLLLIAAIIMLLFWE